MFCFVVVVVVLGVLFVFFFFFFFGGGGGGGAGGCEKRATMFPNRRAQRRSFRVKIFFSSPSKRSIINQQIYYA